MLNTPITYREQELADFFGLQPTEVHGSLNVSSNYYDRILLNIIYSLFKIGIPTEGLAMQIPRNYLRYWLYIWGTYATIYTKKFGWIINPYTVSEFDLYYQPRQIVVTNRFLDSEKVGIVGINCEITKIFDDYRGVLPIIKQYSSSLAACDKAIQVNLMFTGRGKIVGVPDKKAGDTIKEAFAKTTDGTPVVTIGKDLLGDDMKLSDLVVDFSTDFVADKVHELKRSIMNDFLTTIGINNANINKRERLNTDEVNANNDEVETIKSIMLENIRDSFEKTNELTGLNFTVEERFNSSYVDALVEQAVGGASYE